MPNSEVKRRSADGSVGSPHVRVGNRRASNKAKGPVERLGLCFCVICCLPMSFFAAQENLTGIDMNIAQQRSGEGQDVRHHCSPSVKARSSTGPLVLLVLNPESEKFADSDGRLIASGLWQQQRLRKLANYRQEEPELSLTLGMEWSRYRGYTCICGWKRSAGQSNDPNVRPATAAAPRRLRLRFPSCLLLCLSYRYWYGLSGLASHKPVRRRVMGTACQQRGQQRHD